MNSTDVGPGCVKARVWSNPFELVDNIQDIPLYHPIRKFVNLPYLNSLYNARYKEFDDEVK
jgi:hypothetical protein